MKGVILSGGHGTRLRPFTHTGPKQLIPIANKPNILYCLEDMRNAGIEDIAVILGDIMPEKVKELLGDGSKYGVKITYIVQGAPKGIAHAVGLTKDFVGDTPFVVYLGDNILKGGINEMVREFEKMQYDTMVALTPVKNPQQFGVAELNSKGEIVRLVEKPKEPKSNLALVGIYFFTEPIFDAISQLKPSWRNELEITEAIDYLINKKYYVKAHIVKGWWKDTGKPEDILEANRLVLDDLKTEIDGEVEDGVILQGRVKIGSGTIVKKDAVIRGPVIIGKDCTIGSRVYIGPYTSIGDNTTIEESEIENSIVMGQSYIKCRERIIDSLIGLNTKVIEDKYKYPSGMRLILGENSSVRL